MKNGVIDTQSITNFQFYIENFVSLLYKVFYAISLRHEILFFSSQRLTPYLHFLFSHSAGSCLHLIT